MSITGFTIEDGRLMAENTPQPKAQPQRPQPPRHEARLSAPAAWEHHEAEQLNAYLASQGVQ